MGQCINLRKSTAVFSEHNLAWLKKENFLLDSFGYNLKETLIIIQLNISLH